MLILTRIQGLNYCHPEDNNSFKHLLMDGSELGIDLSYAVQPNPEGLTQALIMGGEELIEDDAVYLILYDNFIYEHGLRIKLK